jgi:hypothetical protein
MLSGIDTSEFIPELHKRLHIRALNDNPTYLSYRPARLPKRLQIRIRFDYGLSDPELCTLTARGQHDSFLSKNYSFLAKLLYLHVEQKVKTVVAGRCLFFMKSGSTGVKYVYNVQCIVHATCYFLCMQAFLH